MLQTFFYEYVGNKALYNFTLIPERYRVIKFPSGNNSSLIVDPSITDSTTALIRFLEFFFKNASTSSMELFFFVGF